MIHWLTEEMHRRLDWSLLTHLHSLHFASTASVVWTRALQPLIAELKDC